MSHTIVKATDDFFSDDSENERPTNGTHVGVAQKLYTVGSTKMDFNGLKQTDLPLAQRMEFDEKYHECKEYWFKCEHWDHRLCHNPKESTRAVRNYPLHCTCNNKCVVWECIVPTPCCCFSCWQCKCKKWDVVIK